MKKQKGFTLIELLVVIAIIALLLAILMPSLQVAKERAKRILCLSNLRQTGIALHVYAEEYNGNYPTQWRNSAWTSYYAYSPTVLQPVTGDPEPLQLALLFEAGLIENPEVFYCPSQPRNASYPFHYDYDYYTGGNTFVWGSEFPLTPTGTPDAVRASYNYWIYPDVDASNRPLRQKTVNVRSSKPILVDNIQEWEVVPHKKGSSGDPQGLGTLFADAHASFSKGDNIFDDALWPKDFTSFWNGPGNDHTKFLEILRQIEVSQ